MHPVQVIKPSYDAVIVGARCAGASTALLLAREGARVLAVDRSPFGSDTLSTLALMRGGALQLHRWGLLDTVRGAGAPPVRSTSFHYADEQIEVPIKPRDGVDALYAPRRTVLDSILARAAADAGADVVHGPRLVDVLRSGDGRACGVIVQDREGVTRRIDAGLVIGADGVDSKVARLMGAASYRSGSHATGVVYGFWRGLGLHGYHWYYRPGTGVGAIPTNDDLTCVFIAVPASRFMTEIRYDLTAGYHRVMTETTPELASQLRDSHQEGPLRGFQGRPGYFRQSWGPGWTLVGDAGYFKDPFTAHGITDALRDAELLARAVASGTDDALAEYQEVRDRLSVGLFSVTDRISSFDWDLATLREWHRELSQEMQREVSWLSDFHARMSAAVAGE